MASSLPTGSILPAGFVGWFKGAHEIEIRICTTDFTVSLTRPTQPEDETMEPSLVFQRAACWSCKKIPGPVPVLLPSEEENEETEIALPAHDPEDLWWQNIEPVLRPFGPLRPPSEAPLWRQSFLECLRLPHDSSKLEFAAIYQAAVIGESGLIAANQVWSQHQPPQTPVPSAPSGQGARARISSSTGSARPKKRKRATTSQTAVRAVPPPQTQAPPTQAPPPSQTITTAPAASTPSVSVAPVYVSLGDFVPTVYTGRKGDGIPGNIRTMLSQKLLPLDAQGPSGFSWTIRFRPSDNTSDLTFDARQVPSTGLPGMGPQGGGPRIFLCSICNRGFTQAENLRYHLEGPHKLTDPAAMRQVALAHPSCSRLDEYRWTPRRPRGSTQ